MLQWGGAGPDTTVTIRPEGSSEPPTPIPHVSSQQADGLAPLNGISPGAEEGTPSLPVIATPPAPGRPDDGADSRVMTYTEHLGELRDRLIRSAVALGVGMVVSFTFTPLIFEILKSPVEGLRLIRTGVAEMLITYMKVALIGGVVLSTPVWLYQMVMFIAPGLTRQEKRYLFSSLPGVLASFIIGVLFGYFVMLPPALTFLVHFGEDIAEPYIRVGDYISVVTTLLFWIGVIFETPLLIFVLARIGLVTPGLLKHYRRYAIVGAFVIAAVITPTWDPINQTLVAVPIIVLYEVGVLLSHVAVRARGAQRAG